MRRSKKRNRLTRAKGWCCSRMTGLKRQNIVLWIALIALFVLSGCQAKTETVDFPGVPVEVTRLKRGEIVRESAYYGETESRTRVTVSAKVSGTVNHLAKHNGDRVDQGELILSLDNTDIEATVAQAAAAVQVAEANVEKIKKGPETEEKAAAEEKVHQAEIAVEAARTNLDRTKKLFENGVVSLKESENAQHEYDLAMSRLAAAEQNLLLLKRSPTPEAVAVADAELNQARTSYQTALSKRNDARVISPVSGYISGLVIKEGEFLAAGTPFAVIENPNAFHITVRVSESDIHFVRLGDNVTVKFPTLQLSTTGVVDEVSPSADPRTGLFPVKLTIENRDGQVKPGMVANVIIPLERHGSALVVPTNAVINDKGDTYVYVVEKGVARKRKVNTGIRSEQYIEIIDGLSVDEVVITTGVDLLVDGERVVVR